MVERIAMRWQSSCAAAARRCGDYYGRLEQSRSTQPSPQMLRALARSLRLTDDETDHLYRLAGHAVPDRVTASTHVRPALLFLLDQTRDAAAFICSDTYVVLAQNELCKRLMGDHTSVTDGLEASFAWRWFTDPSARDNVPVDDRAVHSQVTVADPARDVGTTPSRRRRARVGRGSVGIQHGVRRAVGPPRSGHPAHAAQNVFDEGRADHARL